MKLSTNAIIVLLHDNETLHYSQFKSTLVMEYIRPFAEHTTEKLPPSARLSSGVVVVISSLRLSMWSCIVVVAMEVYQGILL